jgi:hypothetical protein
MPPSLYAVLALTLMSFSTPPVFARGVGTIASLPRTDTLQISFTSTGCFHFDSYEVSVRRTDRYSVSVVEIFEKGPTAFDQQISESPPTRVELGELLLSRKEVVGLDRLLKFYRSKKPEGCTTTDTISISRIRNGNVIATEQFVDQSCRADGKHLLRIPEFAQRLKEKQ